MKRAEIILAETRKKRKNDYLSEVRKRRSEMVSKLTDRSMARNGINGQYRGHVVCHLAWQCALRTLKPL